MTPPPISLGLVLCEKAIIEERTRNITLVGTFNKMTAAQFPTATLKLTAFAVLTGGLGTATIELSVTRLETNEDIYMRQQPGHFTDRLSEVPVLFRVEECRFPSPGVYQATLLVDGDWVAQRRFRVVARGAS